MSPFARPARREAWSRAGASGLRSNRESPHMRANLLSLCPRIREPALYGLSRLQEQPLAPARDDASRRAGPPKGARPPAGGVLAGGWDRAVAAWRRSLFGSSATVSGGSHHSS